MRACVLSSERAEKMRTDVFKHNNETHLDEIICRFDDAKKVHTKMAIQELLQTTPTSMILA